MSQTTHEPVIDAYLAAQRSPPQEIKVDPEYGNIRMVTPIGRFAYTTFMKPRASKREDGTMGPEQYSVTLLLHPDACLDLYNAICTLANHRWPSETRPDPANPSVMRGFSGHELLGIDPRQGGLHYPLRQGTDSYMRDPVKFAVWRNLFFVNASTAAVNQKTGASMAPIYKDENGRDCRSDVFYSGCYGRLQITLFAFPRPGQQGKGARGIGVALNAAQFARHGERLAGFDASKAAGDAFASAGAIAPDPTAPPPPGGQVGYGPHSMSPGSVPPGAALPGFAAPPQQPAYAPQPGFAAPPQQTVPAQHYAPPQQPQPAYAPQPGFAAPPTHVPPQQPQQPVFHGARPPGA